jgi:cytochrome c oxidase cbb3-type subunit I
VNQVTHFTHATVGHAHHGMYAFFTMVMFGSIYYILPRILQKEWPSAALISIHFWATAIGISIYVVGLSIGGWIQGQAMLNPEVPFLQLMKDTVPWLFSRSVAGILITIGHIAFAVSFGWMLVKKRNVSENSPTLFNTPPALKA